jgi:hypothetical protein
MCAINPDQDARLQVMVINRLSVLGSGFGVGFSPVHTTLVVVSGRFMMFQNVSGSAVNGRGLELTQNKMFGTDLN